MGKLTAVILNRVSDPSQEHGFSLDAQAQLNARFASEQAWHVAETFTFQETASKSFERKQFRLVLEYIQEHSINVLVVEKPDRLLRNFGDWNEIEEQYIKARGLHLAFSRLHLVYYQDSPVSDRRRILFDTLIADDFRVNLAQETKKGMLQKVVGRRDHEGNVISLGQPIRPSYGYWHDKNTREILVKQEDAEVVREIYRLYTDENKSTREVADHLNDRSIPAPNSPYWSSKAIWRILSNPVYHGLIPYKGELHWGRHEPLVTEEVYLQAKRKMDRQTPDRKSRDYALAGMMRFTNGKLFTGQVVTQKNGTKSIQYSARTDGAESKRLYIRETAALTQLDEVMTEIEWPQAFAGQVVEIAKQVLTEEREAVTRRQRLFTEKLTKVQNRKTELARHLLDKVFDRSTYEQLKMETDDQERHIKSHLEQLHRSDDDFISRIEEMATMLHELPEIYRRSTPAEKARILGRFCDEITVNEKRQVSVSYKEPFKTFLVPDVLEIKRKAEPGEGFDFAPSCIPNAAKVEPLYEPVVEACRRYLRAA